MSSKVSGPSASVNTSTPNYTPAAKAEPNMCVEPPNQCIDRTVVNAESQRQAQTAVGQEANNTAPTETERATQPTGTVRAGDLARDGQSAIESAVPSSPRMSGAQHEETGAQAGQPISGGETNTSTIGVAASNSRPGYIHASSTSGPGEEYLSAGGGMLHVDQPGVQADVISSNGQLGVYDGRIGGRGNAQLVSVSTQTDSPVNVDAGVLRANGAIEAGENGYSFGGTASIIEGGVTLGDATPDASDNMDTSVRVGAAAGLGFSARAHWADSDDDGVPESGFGFDVGPVSMDVRSEKLGWVSNYLGDSYSDLAGHGPNSNRPGHYSDPDAHQEELDNMAWYKPWTWID